MKMAKEWEKPLVENTEAKLAAIRQEWRLVTKMIQLYRYAEDVEKEGGSDDRSRRASHWL